MGFKVRVIDRGANATVRRFERSARLKQNADVGVIEETGAGKRHEGSDLSVGEIAAIHEFGVGVPMRSWLRQWVLENDREIRKRMSKGARNIARGKSDKQKELQRLARWAAGQIKERIRDGINPPNAPSTIEAKQGIDIPLIDTEQFIDSIGGFLR